MIWQDYIPEDIRKLYEVHDYHHAAAILGAEFPSEFNDICTALRRFQISTADIREAGGNESAIPKKISDILRPLGWREDKLTANMTVGARQGSCRLGPGPFLELFARGTRKKWVGWGDQAEDYKPTWPTYSNHSNSAQPSLFALDQLDVDD